MLSPGIVTFFFLNQNPTYLLAAVESLTFFPSREAKCCSRASSRLLGAWCESQSHVTSKMSWFFFFLWMKMKYWGMPRLHRELLLNMQMKREKVEILTHTVNWKWSNRREGKIQKIKVVTVKITRENLIPARIWQNNAIYEDSTGSRLSFQT